MKAILRFSILFLFIITQVSCFTNKKLADANITVTPLSDTIVVRDGSIVYSLPRSVFTVVVDMERTIEIPGPYAKFAGDLLGLDNVIQNESESWSIEGITIRTASEPDPSEYYLIHSNTLFQTNVLGLKREGLIMDLNPAILSKTDAGTVVSKSGIFQANPFDLGSDEYYQTQRDTAFKRITVDSSFVKIPYIVEKKKKLPLDQLAEKAAKRLMEMRDGKHLILTGEATVFPQSDAAINEINRLEKEYTELFTGKVIKEARTFTYQIIPSRDKNSIPFQLFRFSELTGPVNAGSQGGKQVMIEFIPEQKTKDLTIINKAVQETKDNGYDKLFYRVPDVVNIKISLGTDILYSGRKLIYQFGQLVQLPANYLIGK